MSEETINGEFIKVKVTKKPNCMVVLEIWVESAGTKAAYLKAIQNVKKEVSIPGFRKGRAPDALILDKYAGAVESEFKDVVLDTAGNEALQLVNLHPVKNGAHRRPTIKECNKEKGAHFTIEFEAQPIAPQIDFSQLQITEFQPKIATEAERQEAIDSFLHRFISFEEVADRAVHENDYIDLDLTIERNLPEVVAENKRVQVTQKMLPPWLFASVIGKNKGDSLEGIAKINEDKEDAETFPFHGKINQVYTGVLPALDNELAKKVGLETAEELEAKLYKQVNDRAYESSKEKHLDHIISLLLEEFPFEVPQTYIDNYRNAYIEDYKQKISATGKESEIESHPEWISMIEKISTGNLRVNLLFSAIEKQYKIDVSEEDMSREFLHQIGLMQMGLGELQPSDLSDLKENQIELTKKLRRIAITNKIKDLLIDQMSNPSKIDS